MTAITLSDYTIHVGDFKNPLNAFLNQQNYSRIFVLVDENTREYCYPILQKQIPLSNHHLIEIKSGEQHKNIHTCSHIWNQLIDAKADRKALFINLGGGVIGDMGGFCAATYKRGVDFIQIPTTLLADVDSSIGSKLGIDFAAIKNSIGLFKNPKAVFIDPIFLKTLPVRELRSGLAEIIKHGLIADKKLWEKIRDIEDLEQADWSSLIIPSLEIKKRVVEIDPFEQNLRKTLNFGHTVGHAIESWALESPRPLTHGEAIAAGMVCETYLSTQVRELSTGAAQEVADYIVKVYGKYAVEHTCFSDLLRLMKNDKKNNNGKINFTMLDSLGQAVIDQHCAEKQVEDSLLYYAGL